MINYIWLYCTPEPLWIWRCFFNLKNTNSGSLGQRSTPNPGLKYMFVYIFQEDWTWTKINPSIRVDPVEKWGSWLVLGMLFLWRPGNPGSMDRVRCGKKRLNVRGTVKTRRPRVGAAVPKKKLSASSRAPKGWTLRLCNAVFFLLPMVK